MAGYQDLKYMNAISDIGGRAALPKDGAADFADRR